VDVELDAAGVADEVGVAELDCSNDAPYPPPYPPYPPYALLGAADAAAASIADKASLLIIEGDILMYLFENCDQRRDWVCFYSLLYPKTANKASGWQLWI
jgi:hypothetical protein